MNSAPRSTWILSAAAVALSAFTATPVYAHHEAMFGPQSSAVLSPTAFVSAQVFTRATGQDADRRHETTTVFSAGVRPFKHPLSIAFVVPITFASGAGEPSERGFEDALISARHRVDAARVAESLRMDEAYVMAVGGIEIPTGTLDHAFGRGPVGGIAAGLLSLERRPFSLIGYGYYHHAGEYHGVRQSGNAFLGLGTAFTPVDNEDEGKLFSIQLGVSHERTFAVERGGVVSAGSGGSGVFLHPGMVAMVDPRVQFFTLISLPIAQDWRTAADRQQFRVGAGAILIIGH